MIIIPSVIIGGKVCPSADIPDPNFGVISTGTEYRICESAAELQAYLDSVGITIDVT
jgi:hypothetical protein